jgi:hypothetical protein
MHPSRDASRSTFIPGVYNYCDGWCSRCRLRTRCLTFAWRDQRERHGTLGDPAAASALMHELLDDQDRTDAGLDGRCVAEAAEVDVRRIEAVIEVCRGLTDSDPIVRRSAEYVRLTSRAVAALGPAFANEADASVVTAADTVAYHAVMIEAKIRRAVHGLAQAAIEDSNAGAAERCSVQTDMNGSAKLARLLIAESRDAWATLLQSRIGPWEDGPALVQRLEDLDADLARRFPRAMDFVRPGFDDEP